MPSVEALRAIVGGSDQPGRSIPTREVYFLQGRVTRLVKIGMALDTRSRLHEMQGESPDLLDLLAIIVCDRKGALEKELHILFAEHRSHGEWFRPDDEIVRYAVENASPHETLLAHRQATRLANAQPYRPVRPRRFGSTSPE